MQLVVLCHGCEEDLLAQEPALRDALQSPAAAPLQPLVPTAVLDKLLGDALDAAGMPRDGLIPADWGAALQPRFEAAIAPLLEGLDSAQGGERFVAGRHNAVFVEAWRALARRAGIAVRFVYVRRFAALYADMQENRFGLREFGTALQMARQAGADIACFDMSDWQRAPEAAGAAFLAAMGAPVMDDRLPAARMAAILSAAPDLRVEGLPGEFLALGTLYAGKHLGAPLLLAAGDAEALARLEAAAQPDGAVAWLLRQGLLPRLAPAGAAGGRARVPVVPRDGAGRDRAWEDALAELRRELAQAQLRLNEFEAAPGARGRKPAPEPVAAKPAASPAPASLPAAVPALPRAPAAPRRVQHPEDEMSRGARLWRKFRNDPQRFFADSRFPLLRRLGGAHAK